MRSLFICIFVAEIMNIMAKNKIKDELKLEAFPEEIPEEGLSPLGFLKKAEEVAGFVELEE